MEDIKKMIRAIINGQSALKEELLNEFNKLRRESSRKFGELGKKVDKNGNRIDKLGYQLAELEDDAPTREEHDKLDKRITKIEQKVASV